MITGKASDLVLYLMQADKDVVWDLKEHKAKRTLSQNAYYWSLVGKVAQKTRVASAVIHNRNLRDLGLVMRIDNALVPVYIPDNDESEEAALHSDTYHIKPTSSIKTGNDGRVYRCYVMLRGSSTYNAEEMTALLDLMIQEAEAVGVETLTPSELAHIRELENAQKNQSGSDHAKS